MSAVETVARIIDPDAWETDGYQAWRRPFSLATARAAIASLREPLESRLAHELCWTACSATKGGCEVPCVRWREYLPRTKAILDAALSEPRIESAAGSANDGQIQKEE